MKPNTKLKLATETEKPRFVSDAERHKLPTVNVRDAGHYPPLNTDEILRRSLRQVDVPITEWEKQ